MTLKQLHDATLSRVEFDWVEGSLDASFIVGADNHAMHLLVKGLSSFSCDRRFPWGRSESVNKVKIDEEKSGTKITIAMQSGDLLIVQSASYQLVQ
jgi:hypothetical protein